MTVSIGKVHSITISGTCKSCRRFSSSQVSCSTVWAYWKTFKPRRDLFLRTRFSTTCTVLTSGEGDYDSRATHQAHPEVPQSFCAWFVRSCIAEAVGGQHPSSLRMEERSVWKTTSTTFLKFLLHICFLRLLSRALAYQRVYVCCPMNV
jgi:hypothetical protein